VSRASNEEAPASKLTLSPYEQTALGDASAAISPYRTPISALVQLTDPNASLSPAPSGGADPILQVLWRTLAVMGHVAAKTVRGERLRGPRRLAMRPMRSVADVARLDLWEVDDTVRWVEPKYALSGTLLGLATGALGLRGLVIGKPLVSWLAMRQISEYGMRYGFDIHDPEERVFATQIFVAALLPHRPPHEADVSDLAPIAQLATRVSRVVGVVDAAFGFLRRVLRSRRARATPVVAAVGIAVYNVWLLRGVARTAALAYRERFVARKHHMTVAALEQEGPFTSPARNEACPPAPFERTDEARRASAKSGAER